jgi:long-chain acyl-CoA synthetase
MLSVHEMLARSARDHPDKEALVLRGRRMSFAELEEASSRIAGFLQSSGIQKGMRVAIYSAKCIDEVVAIFAIARAGGVLVHINPSFRDEKFHHVLEECEPVALFFHPSKSDAVERASHAGILPKLLICMEAGSKQATPMQATSIDIILREHRNPTSPNLPTQCSESDWAAIIYTSGTTASAKGIIVTHRIFSEATLVSSDVLKNVPEDRLISMTPFSFDGALSQLFTAMLVGGTLVLQDSLFPKDVVQTLIAERITGFHAVPSFWRMLLERFPSFPNYNLPHLRYLSLIGEVFPEDELATLKSILKNTEFFMMYGTTEAFRSTCLPPADFARKRPSVGKPLPGVKIKIVDEFGGCCAAGKAGEIVHSGAFVSPGYWKRKGEATFREDGIHTGDLGWLDSEGYLYFAGRKDTMVKRFGYQVYPEEIEACLQKLDGVAMAAAVCAPDAHSPRIHTFLVCTAGSNVTPEAVKRHCKLHLPHYMMPDEITFLPAMPLTGTYKIDRAQLMRA